MISTFAYCIYRCYLYTSAVLVWYEVNMSMLPYLFPCFLLFLFPNLLHFPPHPCSSCPASSSPSSTRVPRSCVRLLRV